MPEQNPPSTGPSGPERRSMNGNEFPRQPVNKGIVGGVALLSALIPVYVCAYSALLINQAVPVFSRQVFQFVFHLLFFLPV